MKLITTPIIFLLGAFFGLTLNMYNNVLEDRAELLDLHYELTQKLDSNLNINKAALKKNKENLEQLQQYINNIKQLNSNKIDKNWT